MHAYPRTRPRSAGQEPVHPAQHAIASRRLIDRRRRTTGNRHGRRHAARSRRQVFVDRLVAEFGHQIAARSARDYFGNLRARVAQIAEVAGVDWADHDASRLPILGREVLIVDPVDAQGAFLHDALVGVELARAVGASPRAQLAANADRLVNQHDAVLGPLVGGACRTHGDAGRFLAIQTRFREVDGPGAVALAFLEGVDAV